MFKSSLLRRRRTAILWALSRLIIYQSDMKLAQDFDQLFLIAGLCWQAFEHGCWTSLLIMWNTITNRILCPLPRVTVWVIRLYLYLSAAFALFYFGLSKKYFSFLHRCAVDAKHGVYCWFKGCMCYILGQLFMITLLLFINVTWIYFIFPLAFCIQ